MDLADAYRRTGLDTLASLVYSYGHSEIFAPTMAGAVLEPGKPSKAPRSQPVPIPVRYQRHEMSKLFFDVKKGGSDFPLKLTK